MNTKVKKQWIAALRGELKQENGQQYQRTAGALHHMGRFCCLGVLCDLHRRFDVGGVQWVNGDYSGVDSLLPTVVQAWAGIHGPDVHVKTPDTGWEIEPNKPRTSGLAELNDSGFKFREIAKIIEEQL